jgi:hypothetical protein
MVKQRLVSEAEMIEDGSRNTCVVFASLILEIYFHLIALHWCKPGRAQQDDNERCCFILNPEPDPLYRQ